MEIDIRLDAQELVEEQIGQWCSRDDEVDIGGWNRIIYCEIPNPLV